MHKLYDPRMFDVLDERAMRSRFDEKPDVSELPAELKTAEDFTIAGFRVRVADPEGDGAEERHIWVEEKTFCIWLALGNLQISEAVAAWWTELYPKDVSDESEQVPLKSAGDDTCVEFFKQVCERVKEFSPEVVRDGAIRLDALQRWLEEELGEDVLGFERGIICGSSWNLRSVWLML